MDTKTFIDTLARNTGMKRTDVQRLTDATAEIITDYCADFNAVAIPGFGTFESKQRAERVTTHPSTGRRILIPPKITVSFRPSALLKQRMKGAADEPADADSLLNDNTKS